MSYQYEGLSWPKRAALAVVALAVVLGLFAYARGGTSRSSGVALPGSGHVENGQRTVTVLFDGWSWETLANGGVKVGVSAGGTSVATDLSARPASSSDVAWLAAHDPQVLGAAAGRMITLDRGVVCGRAGCVAKGRAIPLGWFSDAARIPTYGTMYQAWGIRAVLYVSSVALPASASSFTLSAAHWNSLSESVASTSGAETRGVDLVSAALGSFFPTTPVWSSARGGTWYSPTISASTPQLLRGVTPAGPLYDHGLGAASVTASGLNPSELTYLSSPTTGCALALCVPGTLHVKVSKYHTSSVPVCDAYAPHGRATLVMASSTWSIDYPHPVHQEVLRNGKGGSAVVLVEGSQQLFERTESLYTGVPLAGSAAPGQDGPVEVAGTFYDARRTPARTLATPAPLDVLYPGWHVCS